MQKMQAVRSTVVPIQSTVREVFARLLDWDITNVKARAVKDGKYTSEEIDAVEIEYKKYLALCIAFPKHAFPTPLRLDELWHQHILFTRDYAAMCQSVVGYFVHHSPFVEGEKPNPNGRQDLHQKYLQMFGEKPNDYWAGCQGPSKGCSSCGPGTIKQGKVGGLCSPNPNCEGKSVEAAVLARAPSAGRGQECRR